MSEANKTDAPKFKDDLTNAKNAYKAAATIDNTSGVITVPNDFYYGQAPEGVNEASDRASAAHRDLMKNAQALATGEMAIAAFAQNPTLQTVSATMVAHKDLSLSAAWGRSGSSRNPQTGEVTTFNGAMQVSKIEERGARPQAEMVAIRQSIKALAVTAGIKD